MHNWDDLRFFLAVATSGSVTAAASILSVNQSTVSRRINAFETELKVRLFDRLTTGFELTPEGEELLHRAQLIEEETHSIDRHVMGKDISLSGSIRVTSSLAIAHYLLIPALKRFNKEYPDITVHLDLSNNIYNLTNREADVAIRVTREAIPERLIARKLGHVEFGVYAQKKYLAGYIKSKGKAELCWVGEDNTLEHPHWLPRNVKKLKLTMRSNDVMATVMLLKQGFGVGRLPCFIGKEERGLEQFDTGESIAAVPVWLLTHSDMRRVSRISLFTSHILKDIRSQLGHS